MQLNHNGTPQQSLKIFIFVIVQAFWSYLVFVFDPAAPAHHDQGRVHTAEEAAFACWIMHVHLSTALALSSKACTLLVLIIVQVPCCMGHRTLLGHRCSRELDTAGRVRCRSQPGFVAALAPSSSSSRNSNSRGRRGRRLGHRAAAATAAVSEAVRKGGTRPAASLPEHHLLRPAFAEMEQVLTR